MKTYSELVKLNTFEERFRYLELDGNIGIETFGFDRYLNQVFYKSNEWKKVRDYVFIRDNGCDLGIEDMPIHGRFIIHHMNPISIEDVTKRNPVIFDPEFLISTTHKTHNAIHYGSDDIIKANQIVTRKPGDTKLW